MVIGLSSLAYIGVYYELVCMSSTLSYYSLLLLLARSTELYYMFPLVH